MTLEEKHNIQIDKTKEPRTKEISKMIGEGGLGAEKYYDIKKKNPSDDQKETPTEDQ